MIVCLLVCVRVFVCPSSRRQERAIEIENRLRIDGHKKKRREAKINAWTHVWRNTQLLFIDIDTHTHTRNHRLIDDDHHDDDIVATNKDYIKDKLIHI